MLLAVTAASGVGAECVGDCDADGSVRVRELVTGVGIALDHGVVSQCRAFDADADATVSIVELTTAVTFALRGCPPAPTPTAITYACGEAAVVERFTTCRRAKTEAECADLGGTWAMNAYSRRLSCHCPTGQNACRCTRDSECAGRCYVQTGGQPRACDEVTEGYCSSREPIAGCWCQAFLDQSRFVSFCNDP